MKIAIPVVDETLKMAENAGHTPYFAVFTLTGGMFKNFILEGVRHNPKVANEDHQHHDHNDHHTCDHDKGDIEHIKAHDTMAQAIHDCHYLVVKMACKNTAKSMTQAGIKLKKYNGTQSNAKEILKELSAEFV